MKILKNKKIKQQINEISQIAGLLWEKGWAEANAGNISVNFGLLGLKKLEACSEPLKLPEAFPCLKNYVFYVTGAGRRMRDVCKAPLKHGALMKITEQGDKFVYLTATQKDFRFTSEIQTHLALHSNMRKSLSKNNVIVHAHPTELIALTHIYGFDTATDYNKALWGMHTEIKDLVPKGLGFVPFQKPGSKELAAKTVKVLSEHEVALWDKHGVMALGTSPVDAFDKIDVLSKSANMYLICLAAGQKPIGLSNKQLQRLSR